jgi:hypothetical protein
LSITFFFFFFFSACQPDTISQSSRRNRSDDVRELAAGAEPGSGFYDPSLPEDDAGEAPPEKYVPFAVQALCFLLWPVGSTPSKTPFASTTSIPPPTPPSVTVDFERNTSELMVIFYSGVFLRIRKGSAIDYGHDFDVSSDEGGDLGADQLEALSLV